MGGAHCALLSRGDTRDRAADSLGRAWLLSGDAHHAMDLLNYAVSVADASSGIEPRVMARSGLMGAKLQLADPAAALAAAAGPGVPTEEPMMRLLEGVALLGLHRLDESTRAFSDALTVAEALLALADSSVSVAGSQMGDLRGDLVTNSNRQRTVSR